MSTKLLPLNPLLNNESTYITFSKALYDLDKAINTNGRMYFTKMVALNLPIWENPNFFIDLSEIGITDTDPNIVIPKTIQYYMENIIRQNISDNSELVEEVVEIAFWKMLNKMGVSKDTINEIPTFVNDIYLTNFVEDTINNGWIEIVTQIPNKSNLYKVNWKTINNIQDIVQSNDDDVALYDNGNKQFLFPTEFKQVINLDNLVYDESTIETFKFNTLLMFYKDDTGIEKLHGINFIYSFENKVSFWEQNTFEHKSNTVNTIGYQFKFNMKSCVNESTKTLVYELQEGLFYNNFSETLSKLNSFLDIQTRKE